MVEKEVTVNDHAKLVAIEGAVIIEASDGSTVAFTPRLARRIGLSITNFANIADNGPSDPIPPLPQGKATGYIN